MRDIDLSGVDPRRWPEIRLRIAGIQEYIALGRRDGAMRDEIAERLGLRPMTFLALVKAWKAHGKACRLPGSGVLDRTRPRPARSLPSASHKAMSDAIAQLGVDARHADLVAEVNRRCDDAGTKRPSTGMVQRLVMQARRVAAPRDGAPEILLGRVVAKLPVKRNGQSVLPDLFVAVLSPEGVIAAHVLDDGTDDEMQIEKLVSQLEHASTVGAAARPLIVPASLARFVTGARAYDITVGPTMARLPRLLGDRLGMLDIAHRRKSTTRAPDDGSPMNVPLDGAEATEAVCVSLDAHNAGRGGVPAFSLR